MKRAYIIYNSKNKETYFKTQIYKLIDYLSEENYNVTVHSTTGPNDLTDQIQKLDGYDLLIISGGDGTMHECVNSIVDFENPPKILYLPSGTINDFAHSLGITKDVDAAIELLKSDNNLCIDIARINDKYFNYVCAFGAFTSTSYSVTHAQKNKFGAFAYVLNGIGQIPQLRQNTKMKLVINDGEEIIEDEFYLGLISNSTSVAGFRQLFTDNEFNDGVFEILFLTRKQSMTLKDLTNFLTRNITSSEDSDRFIHRKVKKIEITCDDDVKWTIDGEEGPTGSIDIEVLNKMYNIYTEKEN